MKEVTFQMPDIVWEKIKETAARLNVGFDEELIALLMLAMVNIFGGEYIPDFMKNEELTKKLRTIASKMP